VDPITDVFRTLHVTAFGQHRLEATAPWGLKGGGAENEEKPPNTGKNRPPAELAHFAMLSRGNCWLNVEGIKEAIPLTGGDFILLARDTSIVMRDSPRTSPKSTFREVAAIVSCDLHERQIANALTDAGLVPGSRLIGSNPRAMDLY